MRNRWHRFSWSIACLGLWVSLAVAAPSAPPSFSRLDASTTTFNYHITDVAFNVMANHGGQIIISLSDPGIPIKLSQQGDRLFVELMQTDLPAGKQQVMDVSRQGTLVQMIIARQQQHRTCMEITTLGDYKHRAYQVDKHFIIEMTPQPASSSYLSTEQSRLSSSNKRLSLNFQNIPVRAVLQLLADFNDMNLVATDAVKGNITLRLNNIPSNEALAIVLKTEGLTQRQEGNVLMIAPAVDKMAQDKQVLASQQTLTDLEPLQDILIPLNYAKASDMANLLKDNNSNLLTARGNVSVDVRTNSLLIRDVPASLTAVRHLILRLDRPVPQVLIEARIVNINTDVEQDLGVKWGITKPNYLSGSIKGASHMTQNHINGRDPLDGANDDIDSRLNVNLPVPALKDGSFVQAPSVGVALAKLGHGFLLDLELQALEAQGNAYLIASPRLMTANQHAATIKSGTEIPYQQSTSSGATSIAFRNAELSLTVTPQITPDQHIMMDLHVTQNKVGADVATGEGGRAPTIDTREITTSVLVDNAQTLVLGGIYEDNTFNQIYRVPFLGSIPGMGFLFRSTQVATQRSELLIFITPKIVAQSAYGYQV